MLNLNLKPYVIPEDDERKGPENCPGYYYVDSIGCQGLKKRESYDVWCRNYMIFSEIKRLIKPAGISTDNFYTYKDYVGNKSRVWVEFLKDISSNFDEKAKDIRKIYIYGKNKTQKTSMALAYAGDVIIKGIRRAKPNEGGAVNGWVSTKKVRYIGFKKLSDLLITESIENDSELKKEAIRELKEIRNLDLLIVDEAFDDSKALMAKSGFQTSFIDEFVRTYGKNIIYISNVAPKDINVDKFGAQTKIHLLDKLVSLEFEDLITEDGKIGLAAPNPQLIAEMFKKRYEAPKVRKGKENK